MQQLPDPHEEVVVHWVSDALLPLMGLLGRLQVN
jgi:hypothetical protein